MDNDKGDIGNKKNITLDLSRHKEIILNSFFSPSLSSHLDDDDDNSNSRASQPACDSDFVLPCCKFVFVSYHCTSFLPSLNPLPTSITVYLYCIVQFRVFPTTASPLPTTFLRPPPPNQPIKDQSKERKGKKEKGYLRTNKNQNNSTQTYNFFPNPFPYAARDFSQYADDESEEREKKKKKKMIKQETFP